MDLVDLDACKMCLVKCNLIMKWFHEVWVLEFFLYGVVESSRMITGYFFGNVSLLCQRALWEQNEHWKSLRY